ncbi:MAG: polyamine aminopropyltransferase [Polyangiales bacterium]
MGCWYEESFHDRVRLALRVERGVFAQRSEFQRVEIFDTAAYGRVLALDGIFMTSEKDEFFYHEMLVHPPLLSVARPERVLIIGGGDGGTAREVLRHPEVRQVQLVEIDQVVVSACQAHLSSIGTAWQDPRLELHIADGVRFVREAEAAQYDVILLDGSDPVGPAKGLFNRAFYEDCARLLRPGGVFALQSESPVLLEDVFYAIQVTLGQVFSAVHPYFGPVPIYGAGTWSWTWAAHGGDPLSFDQHRAERIQIDSRLYNPDLHRGAFAMPNFVRQHIEARSCVR